MARAPASTVYLWTEAASGFLFTLMGTVFSVYLIVEGELGPFRLLILGTVLEGTVLLFEVPTGVVADTLSRRLSIQVGFALTGIGFAVTGAVASFPWFVVGQALWGIGYTFTSGAQEAWITDEVGEEAAATLYVRGTQRWQVGALLGIPTAVGLGAIGLGLPFVASGVGFVILAGLLVWKMPEDHFHRAPKGERTTMRGTFRDGVRAIRTSHVLLLVMAVALLHGAATEGFDRLSTLHLLEDTTFPEVDRLGLVAWFGVIEAVGLLLALVAAEILKRRADLADRAEATKVLAGIDLLLVAAVVAFGLVSGFWVALAAFWLVSLLREIREPVFTAWLNRGLEPSTRATVNSMAGQMDAIGQIAGGPMIGLAAVAWGVPAAIVIAGVLRVPALGLYARALRRPLPPPVPVEVGPPQVTGMPNPE
jgi:DHA3 family tetracycline resistance protein-like MFS transporter